MEKLFKDPIVTLNNIYGIVNNELGKQCLSYRYQTNKSSNVMHKCDINILWPVEMSFSHVASNKKAAAIHAAKHCLTWLYNNKKLTGSKPLLYTKTEIASSIADCVRIDLDSIVKDEIDNLIDVYNNEVKSIVAVSSTTHNEICSENLVLRENVSFSEEQSEDYTSRNTVLAERLQYREKCTKNLPIMDYKSQILESIENNQVLLIKGDTGCGKSTQVPQFIIDAYTEQGKANECNILVSEPRRVSALSLAKRVAKERGEQVGDVVGYHVRFSSKLPQTAGSILFCTTGIFLRRIQSNPTLNGVSHVIIDEAHERTLEIDIMLNLLKKLLITKPSLKIIIMSATLNAEIFAQYFSCSVVDVPGRIYPVKMHFLEDIELFRSNLQLEKDLQESYTPYSKVVQLIMWITRYKPSGSILCFLTGWQEIQEVLFLLEKYNNPNLLILPFHSKLENYEQLKVFRSVPDNVRKIILATDIGESSITIPDVKYVVDSARKKEVIWKEKTGSYSVVTCWVSQANISQRKGRAGRVTSGESYHFLTKQMYDKLQLYPVPAIHRISLDQAVVTSKVFSDEKIEDFFANMIEAPNEKSLSRAVEDLQNLNILDENENLTPLGKRILHFTEDVRLSRALIFSYIFQCLNPVLSILTVFGRDDETGVASLIENSVKRRRKLMYHDSSDHIALLQIYRQLKFDCVDVMNRDKKKWRNLQNIAKIRELRVGELIDSGLISEVADCQVADEHSNHKELIRAVLFSGTNRLLKRTPCGYRNGYFSKTSSTIWSENYEKMILASESVNHKRKDWPSSFLTYISRCEHSDSRIYMASDSSLISPLTVLLFSQTDVVCDKNKESSFNDEDNVLITIKNLRHAKFSCDGRTANSLLELRKILWDTVYYIIQFEGAKDHATNLQSVKLYKEKLLHLIIKMIEKSANGIDSSVKNNTLEESTSVN
ncbi:PREDICTED: putative ATP-dependent RNA helicase DHX30 [Dufourea novaeangliae]|uniref:RNA helicase n=1 Tax=Dufourea novaeangliae TaxID=178035 RepID=A0A154P2B3_DUFNO|nr:PREDICTED: putative ATP-dependent RNA helicase DHX30 [Dufourea novaeangliae]KZC06075.1 Putative ATP-dependent RNA helicase DHX30 [Dufourea novaeangliae]